MVVQVQKLRPGLWRWTAPHPAWTPDKEKPGGGGWGQMVGCVFYEPPGNPEAIVLIDPLVPPEGTPDADRFWRALDQDVERNGRGVAVLVSNTYHTRSTQVVFDRYRTCPGTAIWMHDEARGRVKVAITHTFHEGTPLPCGVELYPITGLDYAETAFYLPPYRALVFADAVIGAGKGRVWVAPLSWAADSPEWKELYRRRFRESLRRLLDLPIDMLLVSHGPPILEESHRVLAEALEAPAWGE